MHVMVVGGRARSIIRHRGSLIREIVRRGHTVLATAPDNELAWADRMPEIGARFEGIPLRRVGTNPFSDLNALHSLTKLMRKEKPDLVFNYTVKPIIYGSLAARRAGIDKVYSLVTGLGQAFVTETLKEQLVNKAVRSMYRYALRNNQTVIFQNPDDAQLFVELGILPGLKNVAVVNGSGVDMQQFQKSPLSNKKPGLVFLWLGRLLDDKGLVELIEAFRSIRSANLELRVLGLLDESHPASLTKEQVSGWDSNRDITFLPGTDDVRPFIEEADVIVLPSYREGTPRAVLEAMAMGRPVITTNVPGCRQTVIDGHNGFLVKAKNVETLRVALQRFVDTPSLVESMGENAYTLCCERYDVNHVNKTMLTTMGL